LLDGTELPSGANHHRSPHIATDICKSLICIWGDTHRLVKQRRLAPVGFDGAWLPPTYSGLCGLGGHGHSMCASPYGHRTIRIHAGLESVQRPPRPPSDRQPGSRMTRSAIPPTTTVPINDVCHPIYIYDF